MESASQIVTFFTYFKICSLDLCHLSQEQCIQISTLFTMKSSSIFHLIELHLFQVTPVRLSQGRVGSGGRCRKNPRSWRILTTLAGSSQSASPVRWSSTRPSTPTTTLAKQTVSRSSKVSLSWVIYFPLNPGHSTITINHLKISEGESLLGILLSPQPLKLPFNDILLQGHQM